MYCTIKNNSWKVCPYDIYACDGSIGNPTSEISDSNLRDRKYHMGRLWCKVSIIYIWRFNSRK